MIAKLGGKTNFFANHILIHLMIVPEDEYLPAPLIKKKTDKRFQAKNEPGIS